MFNQRPNSLLGLEPRQNFAPEPISPGNSLLNYLSPILSPEDYIKYFYVNQFHELASQQHQQFKAHQENSQQQSAIEAGKQESQQQQQQQHQHQQQQVLQPNQSNPNQLQQQSDPNQQQQQQQQTYYQQQAIESEQHQQHQHVAVDQNPNVSQQPLKPHFYGAQHESVIQAHQPSPNLVDHQSTPNTSLSTSAKLTDEERIRNKRERNRKAAANCRRRKDEKLRVLQEENDELRKQIARLQATIKNLTAAQQIKNEQQYQDAPIEL